MDKVGIKELSKLFNVSEQTVRFYDSKGLFPFFYRESNNYRFTYEKDLQWFRMVFLLRKSGMEIKNIQRYINLCMEGDQTLIERLEIIQSQKISLQSKIDDLQDEMRVLTSKEQHYQMVIETGTVDDWNPVNFKELLQKTN
ncbi:MerR family transcriptional regulator [Mesoplasma syrphidae]|uniref:MerR family transcriptional regulator n=1 Tax=Mesoplasma syrphidae TaxID=225999 RepID=A0A2K9BUR0_9MOLU|nr:MerR family transcriptional regulator [Mesoplasma syrphidae]AUF83450.1 MerR family transcriptional regulator [Mesoplasma syrphidae]